MQKEKIALIALVITVVAALSIFLIATNTHILEDLFKEKLVLAEGDCADVNYIGRYASNNTIFDTSYQYAENKSGGKPLKVFLNTSENETSPKAGYNSDIIKGLRDGLIGMKEGETKIIGPIPPDKAYGVNKFGVGAIFTSGMFAFGINQTVIVTNYTSQNFSTKWINIENNFSNFTMPQFIVKNLNSDNATEAVVYPPPYYIWQNSTSIINITDTNVTVITTPTKNTNLTNETTVFQYNQKLMAIFPNNETHAVWNDTAITITSSPVIGMNYTFLYQGYMNVTIHINNITGDVFNTTVYNDQSAENVYQDLLRTITFNRTYILPRIYADIPTMFISYLYGEDIAKAGYSIAPLAGETLTFEATIEKVYKTS